MGSTFKELKKDYESDRVTFIKHDLTDDYGANPDRIVPELKMSFDELHKKMGYVDKNGKSHIPGLSYVVVADKKTLKVINDFYFLDATYEVIEATIRTVIKPETTKVN